MDGRAPRRSISRTTPRRPDRAEGDGLPLVEQVVDEAIAALCAEAVGVQRKLHEGTLDYTSQRKQFGVPIA